MKRPLRVFLSYADRDRPLAEVLVRDLNDAGFNVWSDHEVLPGDNWARKVADALEESEAMVVIVSPAATAGGSEMVKPFDQPPQTVPSFAPTHMVSEPVPT